MKGNRSSFGADSDHNHIGIFWVLIGSVNLHDKRGADAFLLRPSAWRLIHQTDGAPLEQFSLHP